MKAIQAHLTMWDARTDLPDDLDDVDGSGDLGDLVHRLALIADTQGVAIVLPGKEPHEALVITVEGPMDGGVLAGPIPVDDEDQDG